MQQTRSCILLPPIVDREYGDPAQYVKRLTQEISVRLPLDPKLIARDGCHSAVSLDGRVGEGQQWEQELRNSIGLLQVWITGEDKCFDPQIGIFEQPLGNGFRVAYQSRP